MRTHVQVLLQWDKDSSVGGLPKEEGLSYKLRHQQGEDSCAGAAQVGLGLFSSCFPDGKKASSAGVPQVFTQ